MDKKKIVIFEDNEIDLVDRYKDLNGEGFETFVYLNSPYVDDEYLKKEGFKNIYQGLPKKLFSENFLKENSEKFVDLKEAILNPRLYRNKVWLNEEEPVKADNYFSDGLEELCFEIAKNLPKEKFQIYSSNPRVNKEAKEKGYALFTNF